ncbi:MAG: glycoside hydrolase family 2 TIM barrel-domain containing protein [Terrimicrobiaceae bacterium]|nr:glycoside hydrolase family 2 TIM barrel-domain containing protein [Terrimicrobiaceae bacterium]
MTPTPSLFTHNRTGLSLDGIWKFCPDPMQRCRQQRWWENPSKQNSVFPCWDPEGLWEIQVPSTWKKQFKALEWYDGHAVYYRTFNKPKEIPSSYEAFLVFDGIVYASEVFLNGQKMGEHGWGYSQFAVRVTETLQERNELFVLVENVPSLQRAPGVRFDWCNDGGIINGVKLVFVPRTFIQNFKVSTVLSQDAVSLEFDLFLASRDAAACEEVTIEIPELKLSATVKAEAGKVASHKFRVSKNDVKLWCPENPKLYDVKLSTRNEAIGDEIGFREIKTKGHEILLNGEPIRLYGLCVHSEFPDTGRTATVENIRKMVGKAGELGVNFLRCAHYPYAEIFGREMDRAGLLWWEEVPVYWIPAIKEEEVSSLVLGMLEETIRRDWNRSSLIMWSISNECCYRDPKNPMDNNYDYWFKAARLVRKLDPTRLLTCAESGNIVSTSTAWSPTKGDEFTGVGKPQVEENHRPMHTDELYTLFDVLAANLYVANPGEEAVLYPRFVRLLSPYNKPLMLSEFGSMSLLGAKVPDDVLGSEARHALMIEKAYDVFKELPEITGYCPWVLLDGRAPIHWRWYNLGTGLFRYGFLNENWEPKQAFFALKKGIDQVKNHFKQS